MPRVLYPLRMKFNQSFHRTLHNFSGPDAGSGCRFKENFPVMKTNRTNNMKGFSTVVIIFEREYYESY